MMRIPADEVRYHPHSFADPAGRVFWWKGELYRGLYADSAALFGRLLREGKLERLADQGLLIDTEATDFFIDGYEMIVRHRVIPFASYPEEWCPAMLKDAALTLLDLLIELAHCGLTLQDSHPWNLLFDRGRAVYVDLTSITPIRDDHWRGYDEFCRFYQNPLILMSHDQERIARRLLFEYDGVLGSDVLALTQGSIFSRSLPAIISRFKRARTRLRWTYSRQARMDLDPQFGNGEKPTRAPDLLVRRFRKIKQRIQELSLPSAISAGDGRDFATSFARPQSWMPIQRAVHEVLNRRKPSSVLDLGISETGWHSMAVANSGSAALAVGTDSAVLTKLYTAAHKQRLPLLPVFMDFTDPTPSRGLCSHWSVAASERFKCDLVLALANVHQFVFQRSLNFDQIVEGFASFSKRWLIAEFVPAENEGLRKLSSRKFSWYNLENFATALKKRFPTVSALPGSSSGRVLLACEK